MHEILRRSYELLERLEEDERNQVGAFAPRDPEISERAAEYIRQASEANATPATPLKSVEPPPPQVLQSGPNLADIENMVTARVRAEVDAAVNAVADVLGEEAG